MIKAQMEKSDKGESLILKMSGHAEAAPAGEDLVCAGASTLVYTLAQLSMFYHQQKKLKKKPTLKLDADETLIVLTPKKKYGHEVENAFFFMQTGLSLLAENYPNCFDVTAFGEHYGSKSA